MTKKHKREPLLLDGSRQEAAKVAMYQEKLQELFHKIHQLQEENMLQQKVFFVSICECILYYTYFLPVYGQQVRS